jgi:hypothetical protein
MIHTNVKQPRYDTFDFDTYRTYQDASVYIPTPRTSAPAVNAHHQNGIVEHHICSITKCVQIMLIYAMISWHDIITKTL